MEMESKVPYVRLENQLSEVELESGSSSASVGSSTASPTEALLGAAEAAAAAEGAHDETEVNEMAKQVEQEIERENPHLRVGWRYVSLLSLNETTICFPFRFYFQIYLQTPERPI